MSLEAHNFVKYSPYSTIKDEHHHVFTLTFAQMQADMCDVVFYLKNKKGIAKVTDSGLADIVLSGSGLTVSSVFYHSSPIILTILLGDCTPRFGRQ